MTKSDKFNHFKISNNKKRTHLSVPANKKNRASLPKSLRNSPSRYDGPLTTTKTIHVQRLKSKPQTSRSPKPEFQQLMKNVATTINHLKRKDVPVWICDPIFVLKQGKPCLSSIPYSHNSSLSPVVPSYLDQSGHGDVTHSPSSSFTFFIM
eukprot:gb/GECH01010250.1/.p1 GENE.gb/GECH01010250.1/~~gb/GECH01010250.1/.p1  ORF type:complete len:151 (+),score=14.15 gb/GECH01010250.1/:1-453(+)